MLRAVLSVIVSYVAMFLIVAIGFSIAFLLMGVDRAYQPDSLAVSNLWIGVAMPLGLLGAMAGGWICRAIAGRPGPVLALLVIVIALGALEAIFLTVNYVDPPAREGDLSILEAASQSVQPLWVVWLNPVIGAIGVMIGGSAFSRNDGVAH